MPYIDKEYYLNVFKGEPVSDTDFLSLLERASEIVEEMCMYRISPDTMHLYCSGIQECVKKAICAEIEYLDANGGSDVDNGTDFQSAGLGKFSYTVSSSSGMAGSSTNSSYAPRAMRILMPTGLLYRGGRYL